MFVDTRGYVDVCAVNKKGNNILHEAVTHGSQKVIKQLLSAYEQLDVENNDKMTPLLIACQKGSIVNFDLLKGSLSKKSDYYQKTIISAIATGEIGRASC